MMKKNPLARTMVLLAIAALPAALSAASTTLALRLESGTCIYGGSVTQTVETTFGTNASILPFFGTTTYDFYSPPLAMATALTTNDRASGTVFMANQDQGHAADFTVTGRIVFSDYDPATSVEAPLADTGNSANQVIKHNGKTVTWALPIVPVNSNRTIPVGHLLHIAVVVTLVSGTADSGQFLYNGAKGSSTEALLPQNNVIVWKFAPAGSTRLCVNAMSDGCKRLTCVGVPGQAYTVQATTNLAAPVWISIGSATVNTNASFSFTDTASTNYPCRFYRLVGP